MPHTPFSACPLSPLVRRDTDQFRDFGGKAVEMHTPKIETSVS